MSVLQIAGAVGIVALITIPANWFVRMLLASVRGLEGATTNGAGRWIGVLERLLIFVLVLGDEAGAAALVVAAKAILRYPEITGETPHIQPEYVLIGSLASWLLAMTAGVGARIVLGLA